MDTVSGSELINPIMHKEFERGLLCCKGFCELSEPGSIGFCIGPGGAGKTLMSKILGRILYGDTNSWPPGRIPFIRVEADLADRGYFSSKHLMRALLAEIHDPFRFKVSEILGWNIPELVKLRLMSAIESINPHRSHEPDMRTAFINLAKELGVKLIIIDEANLLVLTQKGRVPTDYLESLRRLGDQIGCAIMLFGTFDLLELMGHSAPLNRRTFRVHLERFRCGNDAQMEEFVDFLYGIEIEQGLSEGILTSNAGNIYSNTYGVPGEILDLVRRAKAFCTGFEDSIVRWDHFIPALHHKAEVDQLKIEADLIYAVMNGIPLTKQQEEVAKKRKNNRMKARRVLTGGHMV